MSTPKSTPKKFTRPPTAQQAVLAELRRAILEGDLEPGSQLIQETVAERLGVSRVPVREAMRILQGEGQISYTPHRGYFVTELSLDELEEIRRIRELLEEEAVVKAMPNLRDEDVAVMAEAYQEMELAGADGDIAAMNAAHTRFHFALLSASGMTRLIRILRQLWDAADPYRAVYHGEEASRRAAQKQHAALLRAAKQRDTERAIKILHDHRQQTIDRLRGALDKHK
ncbi:MAG TPA: GntR family transcriptional regulator [Pseudonocardia sp.]|uniref:GntR family transcriptional regulator n=1 Tax=Pseudonocardia sp. TaxID=60912 RepID=UPI002BB8E0D7|nr:GntR family transcriptional regulator [Pseudonocardia sp.]HTF46670.1 GntR family transcriptional regulator [Pseudonocardia sp.]